MPSLKKKPEGKVPPKHPAWAGGNWNLIDVDDDSLCAELIRRGWRGFTKVDETSGSPKKKAVKR